MMISQTTDLYPKLVSEDMKHWKNLLMQVCHYGTGTILKTPFLIEYIGNDSHTTERPFDAVHTRI